MNAALAIAWREYASLFRLPVGWVALALYLFLTGVVFALLTVAPGNPASMRGVFELSAWLLLPVAPAVTMRLLSEEARTGTLETLLTAPVTDLAVIVGKYVGACAFLATMIASTLIHVGVLWSVASPRPDIGPVLAGYLSLALLGAVYLGVGLLVSSLTSNQTLAFLGTLFAILSLLLGSTVALPMLPRWGQQAAAELSIPAKLSDFARGIVDTAHVVFFASSALALVLLSWVSLASRRWR